MASDRVSCYEEPSRLADPGNQAEVARILDLPPSTLNNVKILPRPAGGGAGRVKKFRTPGQNATGRHDAGRSDVEMTTPRSSQNNNSHSLEFDRVSWRFDGMAARVLLYMQDELCELEQKLNTLDAADLASELQESRYGLYTRRSDKNNERKTLLVQIKQKLHEYQGAILSHSRILALGKADATGIESLENWMDGTKPVIEHESQFLANPEDLVSLSTSRNELGALEKFVEKNWSHFFARKKHQQRPGAALDPHVYYYSTSSISFAVRLILTILAFLSLIVPIFALYFVHRPLIQLALVAVFSFLFAIVLSVWTESRNFEIFAAMAAYSAVLVVFLGSNLSVHI